MSSFASALAAPCLVGALLAAAGAGCTDDALCGPGTRLDGGVCVPDTAGAGAAGAAGGQGGSGAAGGQGGAGAASQGGGPTGGGPVDPGYPEYPEIIDHLTIAIRTGDGPNDGTNANALSLCLTQTACFTLDVLDVNDFRRGEFDVYHFTGVGLPRAQVDRVELRSANGADAWRPACLEVQLDGEPVYCEDALGMLLGEGPNELTSFVDPAGLHLACTTCYPDLVTHGPVVGAVTDTTARLVVRTDATRKVAVHLVDEQAPSEAPVAAYLYPTPTDDYATPFELKGLAPGHRYKVFFEVDGELSGREAEVQTAPAAGAKAAFSMGYGSCTRFDAQPIFATILGKKPDLFLFGGDNHYGNTPDLESLWWNYRWALDRPERAALLAATPTLAIWDDHDFVGNNTNGTAPEPGKQNAARAFSHYWANLGYGTATTPGIFSKYSYGDVDFFLLDNRYHRSPDGEPGGDLLGEAQTTWLREGLLASEATFKVLVSGSIWSATGGESWLDFPAARASLFDFLRDENIQGVVLMGGDIHRSQLRRIHRAAAGAYDLPEIVSSPMANSNSACPNTAEPDAEQLACLADGNFFALIDFDTTAQDPQIVARLFDEAGGLRASMTIQRSELQ